MFPLLYREGLSAIAGGPHRENLDSCAVGDETDEQAAGGDIEARNQVGGVSCAPLSLHAPYSLIG